MSAPRINQTHGVSTDMWTCKREPLACTIENRADERSSKIRLLLQVQKVRDLWSIGIIGPRLGLRIGHGSGVCEGGMKQGGTRLTGGKWPGVAISQVK